MSVTPPPAQFARLNAVNVWPGVRDCMAVGCAGRAEVGGKFETAGGFEPVALQPDDKLGMPGQPADARPQGGPRSRRQGLSERGARAVWSRVTALGRDQAQRVRPFKGATHFERRATVVALEKPA